MINIIRVGRERLREAYEIVNKVDQGMNVPEWFVAEPYEEFDFWMKKERGLLYLAVDEEGKAGAMFFVILPGTHPDNLGYDLGMEEEKLKLCAMMDTAAVLPEFRGHYLQYKMMQHAEGDLRQMGYRYLLCTVHPENVLMSKTYTCNGIYTTKYNQQIKCHETGVSEDAYEGKIWRILKRYLDEKYYRIRKQTSE